MKKIFVLFISSIFLVSCNKPGCLDPLAVNYDSTANDEDATCQYIPSLTTVTVSHNGGSIAESGGVIISDGGSEITVRGVCWSTSPNPTISNDTSINGMGAGTFSSIISGLQTFPTYYVRAYAINSNGVGYGNELTFLRLGNSHQGGIIFYLDGNGGGLVVSPTDVSSGCDWGCAGGSVIGADEVALGTGNQNTIDIEAGCLTPGGAADICANLTLGGYSDWYLPSRDELYEIPYSLFNICGFSTSNFYWSSSQYGPAAAYYSRFDAGVPAWYWADKSNIYLVRAVRSF